MRNDTLIPFDEVTGHLFFLLISTVKKKKRQKIAVFLFPLVKSRKKSKLTALKIKKKKKPHIKAIGQFASQLQSLGRRARVPIQQRLPR